MARGAGPAKRRAIGEDADVEYKVRRGRPGTEAKAPLKAAEGTHWNPLYLTAATHGLRHGRRLGLRWRDLDFDGATLTVDQTVNQGRWPALHRAGQHQHIGHDDPLLKVTRRVLLAHRLPQE